MRYQHKFLCVIPLCEADCSRVTHPSATRQSKTSTEVSVSGTPFDLHVLGTPLAFILSQDQTLSYISQKMIQFKFASFSLRFFSFLDLLDFVRSSLKTLRIFKVHYVIQFSRFILLSLGDSLLILPHLLPFVNPFFKLFLIFFIFFENRCFLYTIIYNTAKFYPASPINSV